MTLDSIYSNALLLLLQHIRSIMFRNSEILIMNYRRRLSFFHCNHSIAMYSLHHGVRSSHRYSSEIPTLSLLSQGANFAKLGLRVIFD